MLLHVIKITSDDLVYWLKLIKFRCEWSFNLQRKCADYMHLEILSIKNIIQVAKEAKSKWIFVCIWHLVSNFTCKKLLEIVILWNLSKVKYMLIYFPTMIGTCIGYSGIRIVLRWSVVVSPAKRSSFHVEFHPFDSSLCCLFQLLFSSWANLLRKVTYDFLSTLFIYINDREIILEI